MVSDLPNGEGTVGPRPETATGGPVPSPEQTAEITAVTLVLLAKEIHTGAQLKRPDIVADRIAELRRLLDLLESNQPKGTDDHG